MGGDNQTKLKSSYPRFAGKPVGKQIHHIYVDRLRQFTSRGQYESQNLIAKLNEGYASGAPAVKLSVWPAPGLERPTFEEATSPSNTYRPTQIGEVFGPSWATQWFRVQIAVPTELKDKNQLELHWDANNEGMVWTEDGTPLHGLTGGGERTEWILPESFRDGKEHMVYIEMACNGMFGNAPDGDPNEPPAKGKYFRLDKADIVAVNLEARGLYIDFWIIGDAAREFPDDSSQEHEALQVCNQIIDHFIANDGSEEAIVDCRNIARKYIGENVNSSKIYDDHPNTMISAIGHCHIDTCWLWPWAETKRKIARSWLNQCDLMERYPEHRFCASQAQQYKWLKAYYPSAFDRVKEKVKEGRFHPIGGSWVEHDTNLPSGESLVRQFVAGQRFFESHFGERSTTFWLPDTFGYSPQLPQLCRLAGMSRFFTQKLSWNNINNFPHTTFNWVALDGSQVLCHMTPCETYTADAHFGDVRRSVTQHKSMDQDSSSLLVFGKGDGGGGPTWEHLEKLRRCRGVADTKGALPRLKMGDSVDDFFAKLEKSAEKGTAFATWCGELYFELHRGTYTTQANNKKNNRQAENMMHDIEFLATFASIQDDISQANDRRFWPGSTFTCSGYQYPKKDIDEMWEDILLCQFHDCLPGSCIEMCYRDTDKLYAKLFERGSKLFEDALSALDLQPVGENTSIESLVAINILSQSRASMFQLPRLPKAANALDEMHGPFGQLSGSDTVSEIHPLESIKGVTVRETSPDTYALMNDDFSIKIVRGVITSIYDEKAQREIIPPGSKGNQLVIYDDKPLYWQAWDVEVYHLASRRELTPHKTSVLESGPERVSLLVETQISERSWSRTVVSLTDNSAGPSDNDSSTGPNPPISPWHAPSSMLEFESEIEWHEDKNFLKVEFPVDVRADSASYETQYGIVRRPTHYNTSWDMAKFEVCCHRWADLSEANYGVSVLNDCKYGFACQGNTMRLSLLRSSKAPDGHADMGRHRVRYAVLPHKGPVDARTVQRAREFNAPLDAGHSSKQHGGWSDGAKYIRALPDPQPGTHARRNHALNQLRLGADSDPAMVLDTIKRGEDDTAAVARGAGDLPLRPENTAEKSVVVRLYDSLGGRCRGKLEWRALPVSRVFKTNLLEDPLEEVRIERAEGRPQADGEDRAGADAFASFAVELRAFEVATYKLVLAGAADGAAGLEFRQGDAHGRMRADGRSRGGRGIEAESGRPPRGRYDPVRESPL